MEEQRGLGRVSLLLATAAVAAAFMPVSISMRGIEATRAACQSGTCCPEDRTMCIVGDNQVPDHYFISSGSCKTPPPDQ